MFETITGGISFGKDIFQFLQFLKGIVGTDIISAYFRYDATKVEGDSDIEVELHKSENDEVFWFNVKPKDAYVFVRFPLNSAGCEEEIGTLSENPLPNPNYWRWVQSARSGTIVGGNSSNLNAQVDFVVVGYKPKAVIKYLTSKS